MHTYISHIILNDLKLNPDLLHIKCQVPQGNTQNHWWHVFLERNLASGGIRYYRSWMPEICHMKTDLTVSKLALGKWIQNSDSPVSLEEVEKGKKGTRGQVRARPSRKRPACVIKAGDLWENVQSVTRLTSTKGIDCIAVWFANFGWIYLAI